MNLLTAPNQNTWPSLTRNVSIRRQVDFHLTTGERESLFDQVAKSTMHKQTHNAHCQRMN